MFGGLRINLIPREGGNTFKGSVFGTAVNSSFQGDNYTQELKDRGLTQPTAEADLRRQPVGRRADREGQAVVLLLGSLAGEQELRGGRVREPERRRSRTRGPTCPILSQQGILPHDQHERATPASPGRRRRGTSSASIFENQGGTGSTQRATSRRRRRPRSTASRSELDRRGRLVGAADQPAAARRAVLEPRRGLHDEPPDGDVVPEADPGRRSSRSGLIYRGRGLANRAACRRSTCRTSTTVSASLSYVTGAHAFKVGFVDISGHARRSNDRQRLEPELPLQQRRAEPDHAARDALRPTSAT